MGPSLLYYYHIMITIIIIISIIIMIIILQPVSPPFLLRRFPMSRFWYISMASPLCSCDDEDLLSTLARQGKIQRAFTMCFHDGTLDGELVGFRETLDND